MLTVFLGPCCFFPPSGRGSFACRRRHWRMTKKGPRLGISTRAGSMSICLQPYPCLSQNRSRPGSPGLRTAVAGMSTIPLGCGVIILQFKDNNVSAIGIPRTTGACTELTSAGPELVQVVFEVFFKHYYCIISHLQGSGPLPGIEPCCRSRHHPSDQPFLVEQPNHSGSKRL